MKDYSFYSSQEFEEKYTYTGNDLGATYGPDHTFFRVWAPTAQAVSVLLYRDGAVAAEEKNNIPIKATEMVQSDKGTWTATLSGDLQGYYYTYKVLVEDQWREACDPYARATGVNGKRAMILDLSTTDPHGFTSDAIPDDFHNITDFIFYELHIRDVSMDKSSGIVQKGKYLGLTETGSVTPNGYATGLDYIKSLGVTHVHFLPFYDFGSIDESDPDAGFNWGYDPVNFNVPEGSYSTDPYHGDVRIRELKQMILTLHDHGLGVIMDVVYNHVFDADTFCFNQIVPGYFSRQNPDGSYSNGSGCGNDTASERSMVRKYIVDSVLYWAKEYHISGFRFDLVGLLDTETINQIMEEVHRIYPFVFFYGEGWDLPTNISKPNISLTTQKNADKVPGFAFFNDTLRDALRGSVFDTTDTGYLAGKEHLEQTIQKCFIGLPDWCPSPMQTVNYASCHDNHTLFDRLSLTMHNATRKEKIRMTKLAAAIVFLSQGIPFFQAGEEMLRSKTDENGNIVENSFQSPDEVNSLKWEALGDPEVVDTISYYKGLIAFRKSHPILRLCSKSAVENSIQILQDLPNNVAGFHLHMRGAEMIIFFNPTRNALTLSVSEEYKYIYINDERAGNTPLATVEHGTVTVNPISALVVSI